MHDTTHLFHRIVKITVARLIFILTIDTNYMYNLRNGTNWKKTLIIHSIDNHIGVTAKLDIAFTTFSGKNGKKMLFDLMRKETTETCCYETVLSL